eukprot:6205887-Pleurochrysis_carterae.AAC.2
MKQPSRWLIAAASTRSGCRCATAVGLRGACEVRSGAACYAVQLASCLVSRVAYQLARYTVLARGGANATTIDDRGGTSPCSGCRKLRLNADSELIRKARPAMIAPVQRMYQRGTFSGKEAPAQIASEMYRVEHS